MNNVAQSLETLSGGRVTALATFSFPVLPRPYEGAGKRKRNSKTHQRRSHIWTGLKV